MSKSILQKYSDEAFHVRKITIKFRDKILAGIPRNGDTLDFFMNARHMSDKDKQDFELRIKQGEITEEEKAEIKETAWCVFEKDHEEQLTVWCGDFKAMIREIFVCMGLTQRRTSKNKGEESAGGRQHLQHTVSIDPLRVPFERDGKALTKPDGYVDRIKHIADAAGKRSALGRHDYVDKAEMTFTIRWPKVGADKIITEDDMKKVFAMAQEDGLGACRSQSMGRFDVTAWVKV